MNEEEACAPLLFEHNGNRFAFFAALAHYPSFAWATEEGPGACHYNGNKERIFAKIAALRDEVDVIAVELQHEEIYNPAPIFRQVQDFRELRAAGADIVTGVQSHVPQAMEPYGYGNEKPGIIVYGLGNLFFDQMWSWQTRTTLIARHTIHAGKVISTEILTAVLRTMRSRAGRRRLNGLTCCGRYSVQRRRAEDGRGLAASVLRSVLALGPAVESVRRAAYPVLVTPRTP